MNSAKRLLIVDDDQHTRDLIRVLVKNLGYETETASDGKEALEKLNNDIDLVLLDLMMPDMDGFAVMRQIRKQKVMNDVPVIVLTAHDNHKNRIQAVEAGANDFISKPIEKTELKVRSENLLRMKEGIDAIKAHKDMLKQEVSLRTKSLVKTTEELTKTNEKLHEAYIDTINRLAIASDFKDEDTETHIKRISNFCAILSDGLGMSPDKVDIIKQASALHDIGKIGIPDNILLKPGKLTREEFDVIKKHTTIGAAILKGSPSEFLQAGEIIALNHHERWDGAGYPNGLKGEDIPIAGRICAVADVFDALTTKRPYKKAFSNEKSISIINEGKGTQFDPKIVDIFNERLKDIYQVQEQYKQYEAKKFFESTDEDSS